VQVGDKEVASLDFADICQETDTKPYLVAGHIYNFSFSLDHSNWRKICSFIFDCLFQEDKRISGQDLVESLNVAMARFVDTIIDYPNSKLYVQELVLRMEMIKVLSP